MKSLSIVLFLLAACGLAVAKEVPLPRAKPLSATDPPSLVPAPEVLAVADPGSRAVFGVIWRILPRPMRIARGLGRLFCALGVSSLAGLCPVTVRSRMFGCSFR
jgi:hypothetical protein